MEIERKFLIKNPIDISAYESHTLSQGYISTSPVIRIRKWDDKRILTVKSKGLISREEFEMEISEEEFQTLREKVEGNLIEKTRVIIPMENGLKIELDIFQGLYQGLIYAEVEFESEDEASRFTAPDWFDRELTGDGKYQNSSLSKMKADEIPAFLKSL